MEIDQNLFTKHNHDGINTSKLAIKDIIPVTAVVPAYNSQEGDLVLYSSGGTYRLYAFLAGAWRIL